MVKVHRLLSQERKLGSSSMLVFSASLINPLSVTAVVMRAIT